MRLPVAIAAVIALDVLTSIHVYHSMWPLMGAHRVRTPILPARAEIALPDVVGRYHERLAEADLGGTLAQFEAAGTVREPIGEEQVHRGRAELQRFYGRLLSRGGLCVERCSLTDDGSSCALEYNLTAWGDSFLPHQAGIAVYERARSGFLAAVRLYDDIERPPPAS